MKSLVAFAVFSLVATAGISAPCRDAHGKFIKCPPAAAAAKKATRCKDAKGKFAKCGTAGAKPA